jgi:threonine dehydratase
MTKQVPLSAINIDNARQQIDPIFLNSDLLRAEHLSLSLLAKDETQNPIRSFKGCERQSVED